MIVVDTSVWSLAFRRRSWPNEVMPRVVKLLQKLTREKQQVVVPGIVIQELLSGVKDPAQGERIKELMEGYPLLLATRERHIEAANISNICRKSGVSAATVDCLIAAQCIMGNGVLLTLDDDFTNISRCCGLRLYPVPVD
ncbi:MAG: PIN domain-containing protein [Deltaproteobacteria bacterium]|nr:PIN domain-containing protein [Deltaproteobacteria bacterium]